MSAFSALPLAEQARQLANPEGEVGLAVAEWLNGNNRQSNAAVLAALDLQPGCQVLEIGFGNGRAAGDVVGQADDIRYTGIDTSPTMVAEATRFNAALIAAGRARFMHAPAEHMPFADAGFDRVFAIGVMHFWRDPGPALAEIRRVMRTGGLAIMSGLDARAPPPFARPEYGFHLRDAASWDALFRQAGFGAVDSRSNEVDGLTPDGTPIKRYTIRVIARA